MNTSAFKQVINTKPFSVTRAALQFAKSISYPDLDVDKCLNQITALANDARDANVLDSNLEERPARLASYLYEEAGFQGDEEDYTNPENSYLNKVLETGMGIPISLTTVYVSVAKQLDLNAFGIGLPGHFIAGVGDSINQIYIDPFRGTRLSGSDCVRLVRESTGYKGKFRTEWLSPTPPRDVVLRMLNNLRISHMQRQEWDKTYRTLDLISILRPDLPDTVRDKGLIAYASQDYLTAAQLLEEYIRRAPKAEDRAIIQQTVGASIDKWARLN